MIPTTLTDSTSSYFDISTNQIENALPPHYRSSLNPQHQHHNRKEPKFQRLNGSLVNYSFEEDSAINWTEASYQFSQPIQFNNRSSNSFRQTKVIDGYSNSRSSGIKSHSLSGNNSGFGSEHQSFISNTSSLSTEENLYFTPCSSLAPSRVNSADSFEDPESTNSKYTIHSKPQMPVPINQLPHAQNQKHHSNRTHHNQHNQRDSSSTSMGLQQRSGSPSSVHSGGQNSTYSGGGGSHNNSSHQSKCRQLPCRTFISTGSCPYGDRCVFLHDPRIMSKPIYIRCKVKIYTLSFTFFARTNFCPFPSYFHC